MSNTVLRLFIAPAFAATVFSGCATTPPRHAAPMPGPVAPLVLFDEPDGVARAEGQARADWPASDGYDETSENVRFRETIIDIQGPTGSNRDWVYQRFESRRTGNWRR